MWRRYRMTKRRMLEIEDYYGIDDIRELDRWQREFNIPPIEVAPIIFDHKGSRHLVQAFWSLIAPGTESIEEARKVSTFNARAESLMTKPTFTNAFLKRRCIVPAEAFYEWVGPKGGRQPLSIQRAAGKLLSMAGLFNYWRSKDAPASPIATFTVVTTMPNKWMARIHNRMPVILQDNQINSWLDPTTSDPQKLRDLLKSTPEDFLQYHAVSKELSSARTDEPACAAKIDLDCSSLLRQAGEERR